MMRASLPLLQVFTQQAVPTVSELWYYSNEGDSCQYY